MTNLKEGQRIDVIKINKSAGYVNMPTDTFIAEIRESGYATFFHANDSFGNKYKGLACVPQGFTKVGTFIVKSLNNQTKTP